MASGLEQGVWHTGRLFDTDSVRDGDMTIPEYFNGSVVLVREMLDIYVWAFAPIVPGLIPDGQGWRHEICFT